MANTIPITLIRVEDVADGTKMFTFEKPAGFTYEAGQYVALRVPNPIVPDARGGVRSMSLTSSPFEETIAFAMRSGESGFKQTMWSLKPGDVIEMTKAVGAFTEPKEDARPMVFLVGGIGVTPARSILREAAERGSEREYVLFSANRFEKDAPFDAELRSLKLKRYRYVTVLSKSEDSCAPENDERGYICRAVLEKYLTDIPGGLFFLCGSPDFANAMQVLLDEIGVPKENRKMDPFTGLRQAVPANVPAMVAVSK